MPDLKAKLEKLKGDIPVPVVELAKMFGIEVFLTRDLADDESGLIRKEDGRYVIYVNEHHGGARQRFTIAHELAHFILHKERLDREETHVDGIVQPIAKDGTGAALYRDMRVMTPEERRMEAEANELAAEILMPEEEFRRIFANSSSIEEVAKTFAVSPAAAAIRAKTLLGETIL